MFSRAVALLVLLITIGSLQWTEESPIGSPRGQEEAKEALTLPSIVYGPINHQLGNEYQSAGSSHAGDNSSAPAAPRVYGSTNSQVNNKYVTIAHAGKVYVLMPIINSAQDIHSDHAPAITMPQNDNEGSVFNASDPAVRDMEEFIEECNSYQLEFNLMVHLGSPFLTDNEITPSLREDAKSDEARQAFEIKWLFEAVKHKLKLVELHGMIISMYDKLASREEVTSEENIAVRDKLREVRSSEGEFHEETQNFIMNIL